MTDRESYIRQETVTGVVPMLKGDRQYSFLDLFLSTSGFAIATWCYTQGAYVAQYLGFKQMLINIFCFNIVWVLIECLPVLFAVRYGGVRPEITETELELTDMINPELCDLLEQKGRSFVPVSIRLEQGATVITGANMGGKSVAMKTVALNVLLLQAGFLVCAKSARMPLFWSVHMLFDDLQSIQSGLSGFGSEIVQFQKALEEVEQGYSLFLLDDFARGTNPDEGAIIVQAVTRYLNDVNAISLLTTHYDKVAENARLHYQIIGLRDVDPEQIRQELAATGDDGIQVIARHMNYGLYRVEGKSDCPRDALNICRMLSLKPEILEKIEQAY